MTSTELAIHENGDTPSRDIVDGWLTVASDVIKLANVIADTDFVPDAYRDNPPAVAAAILTGRELGIGPLTSLRHVQIVKGVPTLSAEYKRARVLAAGHEFDILDLNTQRCKVSGRRRGSTKPALEITFTMDDARTAGLIKDRGAWKTRPRRMLFARAGSELCDFLFADVVNGLPTAEIVADGSDDDEFAGYDEPPPKPAKRTARRQTAPKDASPATRTADAASHPQPAVAPTTGAGEVPQPPLPGEDDDAPPADDRHRKLVGVVRAHFKRLGFGDDERDQRLAATAKLAAVAEIATTNNLDETELSAVADTLARCRDRDALIALLAAADQDPATP